MEGMCILLLRAIIEEMIQRELAKRPMLLLNC